MAIDSAAAPPATTTLVEHRRHRDVLLNNGRFQTQVPLHTASMAGTLKDSNLSCGNILTALSAQKRILRESAAADTLLGTLVCNPLVD